ncbi:MAG TPA: DUF1080 domain-containing protein [Lacunisphaera sp.]|nr:DUF1080 domain-containing protein [Lacunisphaera sp.]
MNALLHAADAQVRRAGTGARRRVGEAGARLGIGALRLGLCLWGGLAPFLARATEANVLSPAEQAAGWRLLWDGRSAEGWRGAKEEKFPAEVWRIEEGVLSVQRAAPGAVWRGADIVTRERFTDFELSVDFRLSAGANSGIKYYVDAGPGQGGASSLGLEYQLIDDERHPDARQGRDGNRRLGAVYDLYPAAGEKAARPPGEWNNARVVARGAQVEHWLNGTKVAAYTRFTASFRAEVQRSKYATAAGFGAWRDGHILLQDHGDAVDFRNVKIRELPPQHAAREGGAGSGRQQ